MTTAAETLAPHFAAIAHQLGRIADALEAGSASGKPQEPICGHGSPSGESPAPEGPAVSAEGPWIFAPDGFEVAPTHDGQPMTYKGAGLSWDGDYEQHVLRFACDCGLTCEVITREMDGGPETQARRSQQ